MRARALALIVMVACADDDDDGPAKRGQVTVHVLRDELPVVAAPVVFHDAGGRVLGSTTTDASGIVSGEITAGGMVTVLDPEVARRLTTITSIGLGATLELPLVSFNRVGEVSGRLMVEPPATAPPSGTDHFEVHTPCTAEQFSSFPISVPLYAGCGAEVPVVLVARGPGTFEDPGPTLGFATARAGADRIARPSAWSTACTQVSVTSAFRMDVTLWPRFVDHAFRGIPLPFCQLAGETIPALDLGEGAIARAIGYVQAPSYEVNLLRDLSSVPAALAIDTSADLLRGEVELDEFDATGARWRRDGSLADADAVEVTLEWPHEIIDYTVWRFVLPPDATSVAVPELPAELVTWQIIAGLHGIVIVRHVEASWLIGVDDVHTDLPLVIEGAGSKRDIPRGSTLRDAVHTFSGQIARPTSS